MDKLDMIMKLVDTGFSKDEIMDLLKPVDTENVDGVNTPVQKNVQEETSTNLSSEILEMEEDEKNAKEEDAFKSMFDNLNASVEAFNKKIQSFNTTIDEMKTEDLKTRTDNDIIASIITPKGQEIK